LYNIGSHQNQAFLNRALFECQKVHDGLFITWVTAKTPDGFSRIGNDATGAEGGDGGTGKKYIQKQNAHLQVELGVRPQTHQTQRICFNFLIDQHQIRADEAIPVTFPIPRHSVVR